MICRYSANLKKCLFLVMTAILDGRWNCQIHFWKGDNLITIPYKPNLHSRQKLQNYNFTGQHRVPSEIFYNVAMVKTFSSLKILAILRWQTGLFNNFLKGDQSKTTKQILITFSNWIFSQRGLKKKCFGSK